MEVHYKKVSSAKFTELQKRIQQQTAKKLIAALYTLKKDRTPNGNVYTRIAVIVKVDDDMLPYIVILSDGNMLKYNDVKEAKFMAIKYYEMLEKYKVTNDKIEKI